MTLRRWTAIALLVLLMLLVIGLPLAGCGGRMIPPSDEVTTRMNEKDEAALDDASGQQPDAGAAPDAAAPPR